MRQSPVQGPDFDRMSKDEVIAWLDPPVDACPPSPEPDPQFRRTGEVPVTAVSVWLPVPMLRELDRVAGLCNTQRADVIRQALSNHLAPRTGGPATGDGTAADDDARRDAGRR